MARREVVTAHAGESSARSFGAAQLAHARQAALHRRQGCVSSLLSFAPRCPTLPRPALPCVALILPSFALCVCVCLCVWCGVVWCVCVPAFAVLCLDLRLRGLLLCGGMISASALDEGK